ncbi:hypothetical protein [Nocardia gipuzkoensis]
MTTTTATTLPLLHGYVRDELVTDPAGWDLRIARLAASAGFDLGAVFHEPADAESVVPAGFLELLEALQRADAHFVAIPAGHLGGLPVPSDCLVDMLRSRAAAEIWELPP